MSFAESAIKRLLRKIIEYSDEQESYEFSFAEGVLSSEWLSDGYFERESASPWFHLFAFICRDQIIARNRRLNDFPVVAGSIHIGSISARRVGDG
jgi:hypothetical protein